MQVNRVTALSVSPIPDSDSSSAILCNRLSIFLENYILSMHVDLVFCEKEGVSFTDFAYRYHILPNYIVSPNIDNQDLYSIAQPLHGDILNVYMHNGVLNLIEPLSAYKIIGKELKFNISDSAQEIFVDIRSDNFISIKLKRYTIAVSEKSS